MFDSVFLREKINTGRQPELDLLKSVSIFFVIFAHVCELIFSDMWEDLAYCDFTFGWQLLWIWASCVVAFGFMFSMGSSMPFGKNLEPATCCKRGVKLIISWIVLRLCYLYPVVTMYADKVKTPKWLYGLATLINSDILCFAGLFFIFVGLLLKKHKGIKEILMAALGLFFISHFLQFHSDKELLNIALGNFLITPACSFPFIAWIMAPTLGLCWGSLLQHCSDKDKLYSWTGILGLIGLAIFGLILYSKGLLNTQAINNFTDVNFFYHANILTVTLACCLLAIFLSLAYGIVIRVQQQWFVAAYKFLAGNLTNIYYAQWILIPWLTLILPHPTMKISPWWAVLFAWLILAISVVGVKIYRAHCASKK